MSPTTQNLFQQAIQLPDAERVELAQRILATVQTLPHEWINEEIACAWELEIQDRVEAADRGEIATLSAADVDLRLREKYGFLAD